LRQQADEAEGRETVLSATPPVEVLVEKKGRVKGTALPKVRKGRAKKEPPRLRARWGVFDAAMKQVAIFDYNQRAAAEAKVADLLAKKKSLHFLQMVKEPIPVPERLVGPVGRCLVAE
jgi:hypothetical protein